MSSGFYLDATPDEIKNAKVSYSRLHAKLHPTDRICKGLHLITMSTPNGKKVQIMLEELKAAYGIECNIYFCVE